MISKFFIHLDTVDSTNIYAHNLINSKQVKEITVVSARYQTHGRGQQSNVWLSEASKNITFSLIVEPRFISIENQFKLNIATSLAIYDFFELYIPNNLIKKLKIKWPNDIYFSDKKLGGVLIENSLLGELFTYSIIGIGLNINQNTFNKSLNNPISLSLITEQLFDCNELLINLVDCFAKRYLELKDLNQKNQENLYINRLLNFNTQKSYIIKDRNIMATIVGLGKYGKLKLIDTENLIHECHFKELVYLFGNNS